MTRLSMVRVGLVVVLAIGQLVGRPVQGQSPEAMCWVPAGADACRTFLVTETGLPIYVVDAAVRLGLDWNVGLMVNVSDGHALGGALTLVGENEEHRYSGLEFRYRRLSPSGLAGEVALGGAWMRPLEGFTGTRHFRSHLRVGLWINQYLGAFVNGSRGEGDWHGTTGPQIGSWPGLILGAALSVLFVAVQ